MPLIDQELTNKGRLAGSLRDSPVFVFPALDFKYTSPAPSFLHWIWGTNLDLHDGKANALLTEPTLPPLYFLFLCFIKNQML